MVGFPLADQSAVAAINRALRVCRVRSRYPGYFVKERNRRGRDQSAPTEDRIISSKGIIGPYGCPDECVKGHKKEEIVGLTDALRWYLGFHFREAYS